MVVGNSGKVKVGAWDEVGYVMISIDSPSIIPIARSDEHCCSYEVLGDFYFKKRLVPKEKYVAVFAHGNNYLWEESVKKQQEAFRRFRMYGGKNGIVKGMNTKYIANMDDFVEGDGRISVDGSTLSPIARFVIGKLESIARGVTGKDKGVFERAYNFISWLEECRFEVREVLVFAEDTFGQWQREILQAEAGSDFDRLSRLFFTFNGIKNNFHNRIRSMVNEKPNSAFELAEVRRFWGNLELAMREFERLSQI